MRRLLNLSTFATFFCIFFYARRETVAPRQVAAPGARMKLARSLSLRVFIINPKGTRRTEAIAATFPYTSHPQRLLPVRSRTAIALARPADQLQIANESNYPFLRDIMVVGRRHIHATDAALRLVLRGAGYEGMGSVFTASFFMRDVCRQQRPPPHSFTVGKWRHGWAPVSHGDVVNPHPHSITALNQGILVIDKYVALGLPPVGSIASSLYRAIGAFNRRRGRVNCFFRVSLNACTDDPCNNAEQFRWLGARIGNAPTAGSDAIKTLSHFLGKARAFTDFTVEGAVECPL